MSKTAMKLALEQRITDYLSAGGLFNPELADHLAVRDLLIDCRKALAEPDFWAGYVPEPDGTCSNTLRIQGKAYPRTCKKCGLGPCVELAQQALDKKAENARELGLMPYNGGDYEPAQKRPRNCGTGYCSCIECVVEPAPVAWLVEFENGEQELHFEEQSVGEINTPLYTSPPAQKECEKCSHKKD